MPRTSLLLIAILLATPVAAQDAPSPKRVAAIVTAYYHNSHADVIVSRLLQTSTLDGQGDKYGMQLVSLYTDQVSDRDKSRDLAKEYDLPIYDNVADALTLGTGKLAVDGVLLVAEHGKYDRSETGQIQYPKRRLMGEIVKVFEQSERSVPVFCDKHLADNWQDAKWIYDASRRLKFPMMAGSSLPGLWRYPPADVKRGAKLKQVVAVSYHTLDAYGFHALEMLQCLVERRAGGETGISRVSCLEGDAVWQAGRDGVYDQKLLDQALSRLKRPPRKGKTLEELVKKPVLFSIYYQDGLAAHVLTLNGALAEWGIAWRYAGGNEDSTLFFTQEARPFMHFHYLTAGIDRMMQSGKPTWPVERTLLTSGMLDALLISKRNGKPLETPYLNIKYQPTFDWKQPPAPPEDRPIKGQ